MGKVSYELSTMDGQNSIDTRKITGKLDCIIIDCNETVEVIVQSSLGYNILTRTCMGVEYIAPRHKVQEPKDNLIGGLQLDKFNLDENLTIIVSGQVDTDIKFIFRFD